MEKTKSIFELECRLDISDEYMDFINVIKSRKIFSTRHKNISVADYLNQAFSYWPHREGAHTIQDYLDRKQINPEDEQQNSMPEQVKCLFAFELYYNILRWGSELDKGPGIGDDFLNYIPVANSLATTIENLEWLFEQFNYAVRERKADKFFQYVITKRDAEVDAAVEACPELSEYLLGYMDLRNRDNIAYKHDAIRAIADVIENKKRVGKEFAGTDCSGLADTAFFAFNNLNIRHDDGKQIQLTEQEQMEMYDNLFRICLFLLQYKHAMELKKEIDKYKSYKK